MKPRRFKRTIKKVFSGTGLNEGFSDADLLKAVKNQIAVSESNRRARLVKAARIFGTKFKPTQSVPLTISDIAITARDAIIRTRLEKLILKDPARAKKFAAEFKGTKYEAYFTGLFQKSQAKSIGALASSVKKIDRHLELTRPKWIKMKKNRGKITVKALHNKVIESQKKTN